MSIYFIFEKAYNSINLVRIQTKNRGELYYYGRNNKKTIEGSVC